MLCKVAAALAAPLMVYADVVTCASGAVNCHHKEFSGMDVVDCAGSCDGSTFYDRVQMTCREACSFGTFFDRSEGICVTKDSCRYLRVHDTSRVTCRDVGSCLFAIGYGGSRIECVGLETCNSTEFYDESVVECTGTRSCLQGTRDKSPGALVPSVCAAGKYGFPSISSGETCHPCPVGTAAKPFPGRGDVAERCTCPRGQKVISGKCVVVEKRIKCTNSSNCDRNTFKDGETVDCSYNTCYTSRFENATALCTEYRTCTGAWVSKTSRADCIGEQSCRNLQTDDKGVANCTGGKACFFAQFRGEFLARCEGPNSCLDAQFTGQSEALCTGKNACRNASDPDKLIATVCPGKQYGFPNSKGEGCQPCPTGLVGHEFPGRGNLDARCK